jgi:hypothetical protein
LRVNAFEWYHVVAFICWARLRGVCRGISQDIVSLFFPLGCIGLLLFV